MTIPCSTSHTAWHEYFPVAEKLVVDSPADTLIVDIGGGIGHDLIRSRDAHPQIRGRECALRKCVYGLNDDGWIFGVGENRKTVQGAYWERRIVVAEGLGTTGYGKWAVGRMEIVGSG